MSDIIVDAGYGTRRKYSKRNPRPPGPYTISGVYKKGTRAGQTFVRNYSGMARRGRSQTGRDAAALAMQEAWRIAIAQGKKRPTGADIRAGWVIAHQAFGKRIKSGKNYSVYGGGSYGAQVIMPYYSTGLAPRRTRRYLTAPRTMAIEPATTAGFTVATSGGQ